MISKGCSDWPRVCGHTLKYTIFEINKSQEQELMNDEIITVILPTQ